MDLVVRPDERGILGRNSKKVVRERGRLGQGRHAVTQSRNARQDDDISEMTKRFLQFPGSRRGKFAGQQCLKCFARPSAHSVEVAQ